MIISHYEKRKADVEEYFKLLRFLLTFEPHRGKSIENVDTKDSLIVSQEMQCVAKSQFIMVLYNLVESTVCDCLNAIYDAIKDEYLIYGKVSEKIRTMWRNYLKKKRPQEAEKSDDEIFNMPICFESLAVNISGSLDYRKIIEVFSMHGCLLDESPREKIASSFLVVKAKRNSLAHGNESFSACGSNYLLSDLQDYKEHIVKYMGDVVKKTNEYIANECYKKYE